MGDKSQIQWTNATWNPTVGCDRISPGCARCYAKTLHDKRHKAFLAGKDVAPQYAHPFEVLQTIETRLAAPLRWRKPRKIFVNSVSDLFHKDVPETFILSVFTTMEKAPQHTFQILTKRALRMREVVEWVGRKFKDCGDLWPLPNVWLGVSVENQHFADERIPLLLQTPAAVRFISAEPLLGPVDLGLSSATCSCCARWSSRWVSVPRAVRADFPMCLVNQNVAATGIHRAESNPHGALAVNGIGLRPDEFEALPALDWVIVGGESGKGARPFKAQWARAILQQCKAAGVACFIKQFGSNPVDDDLPEPRVDPVTGARTLTVRQVIEIRDSHGGDPAEWPEDLRVREFPHAPAVR